MINLVKGIDLFLLACHQSIINWLNQPKFKLALISGRCAGVAALSALLATQSLFYSIFGVAIFLVIWIGSSIVMRYLESLGDVIIQRDIVIKIITAVLAFLTIQHLAHFILNPQLTVLMMFFQALFFMSMYYFARCGAPKPKKKEEINFSVYESM